MYVRLRNGFVYAAGPETDGSLFIYTSQPEKAGAGFEKTEYGFKKSIALSDAEVEEYFDLKWMFRMDVGIENAPDEWTVTGDSDLPNGKVVLRYGLGNFQGWHWEDRGVCNREFDIGLSTDRWVEKITIIRNGTKCPETERTRRHMSKEEFVNGYLFYNSGTL